MLGALETHLLRVWGSGRVRVRVRIRVRVRVSRRLVARSARDATA